MLLHPSHWRAERCCRGRGRSSVTTEGGRFLSIDTTAGTKQRHVLAAEALFGVRGSVREPRCPEATSELRGASAASITASGRCPRGGSGRSACSPALVRGQKEPGGRCGRREENDASRKGHSCRWIIIVLLFTRGFQQRCYITCMT